MQERIPPAARYGKYLLFVPFVLLTALGVSVMGVEGAAVLGLVCLLLAFACLAILLEKCCKHIAGDTITAVTQMLNENKR
jgi:hypothetical protein